MLDEIIEKSNEELLGGAKKRKGSKKGSKKARKHRGGSVSLEGGAKKRKGSKKGSKKRGRGRK